MQKATAVLISLVLSGAASAGKPNPVTLEKVKQTLLQIAGPNIKGARIPKGMARQLAKVLSNPSEAGFLGDFSTAEMLVGSLAQHHMKNPTTKTRSLVSGDLRLKLEHRWDDKFYIRVFKSLGAGFEVSRRYEFGAGRLGLSSPEGILLDYKSAAGGSAIAWELNTKTMFSLRRGNEATGLKDVMRDYGTRGQWLGTSAGGKWSGPAQSSN